MKRFLMTAAVLTAFGTTASAATLDFGQAAKNNERGFLSGAMVTLDGVNVTLTSNYFPYYDHDVNGEAGLGVCKGVSNFNPGSSNGTGNRCDTGSSDDNVTNLEMFTLGFDSAMNLSNLLFNEEGHNPFGTTAGSLAKTLLFAINGDALARYTFGQLSAASFGNVVSASFAYDDNSFVVGDARNLQRNAEQFYLGAATVAPVPVPAALSLLVAGIGGLGLMGRKRRKAA